MPPLLRLDNAIAGFESPLVTGLSLSVEAGQFVALRGVSGSGKTTLLRAMCGLIDLLGGMVTLEGKAPGDHGWPQYRRRVVYVSQQPVFVDGTVEENLARPFAYRGAGSTFPEEWARDYLDRLLLPKSVYTSLAQELSVGQQQRVALTRALLLAPRVVLLDEPTSALDDESAEAVAEMLKELARSQGLAGIVASHSSDVLAGWCTEAIDLQPYRHKAATDGIT